MATCAPFEGNSDFYGLGIRVGVYLQWISSWISLLLDPESAQATFDSNSVFVFAIAIATVIAARQGAAAIEMYLMLQFMLGFFVTTLSTLGVRLWFMSPDRLVILESKATEAWATGLKAIEGLKARFREERTRRQQRPKRTWREWIRPSGSRDTQTYTRAADSLLPQVPGFGCFGPAGDGLYMAFNVLHFLWSLPTFMPLRTLSSLKPPGLSWSGVVWRTTIAAMVAAYNLTFWFDSPGKGAKQPPRPGCGHPYVFLFSKQRMEGPVVILGHIAAIIIAIFVFPATLILLLLTARLTVYACMFLYRDMLYMLSPNTPQTIRSALDRVNALLEKQGVPFIGELASPLLLMNVGFASMVDVLGFLATPKGEAIRFSDVIRLCVSLGTGKVAVREGNGTQPAHGGQMSGWKGARLQYKAFCFLWNLCVILSIAWFIASIEFTIRWNDIRGVNTIDSTGQLIPFIVGCVSASQVMKKLMLFAGARKYPDWANVKLEVETDVGGTVVFQVIKRDAGDDSSRIMIDEDHGSDGRAGMISLTTHTP